MKFRFTKSGGFASIKYTLNDDSKNLSSASQKTLESLPENSKDLKPKKSNSLAKDILKYHLEIDNKGQPLTFDFDDSTLPDGLSNLFSELSEKSNPAQ